MKDLLSWKLWVLHTTSATLLQYTAVTSYIYYTPVHLHKDKLQLTVSNVERTEWPTSQRSEKQTTWWFFIIMINDRRTENIFFCFRFNVLKMDHLKQVIIFMWILFLFFLHADPVLVSVKMKHKVLPFLAGDIWGSVSRCLRTNEVLELSPCFIYGSAQRKYTQSERKNKPPQELRRSPKSGGGSVSCCYVTRFVLAGGREQVRRNYIAEWSLQQRLSPG